MAVNISRAAGVVTVAVTIDKATADAVVSKEGRTIGAQLQFLQMADAQIQKAIMTIHEGKAKSDAELDAEAAQQKAAVDAEIAARKAARLTGSL